MGGGVGWGWGGVGGVFKEALEGSGVYDVGGSREVVQKGFPALGVYCILLGLGVWVYRV